MVSYIVAGLLVVAGAYFLVRLIEVDRINKETPNQDDPFPGEEEKKG